MARAWRHVRRYAWMTVGFVLIAVGLVGVWIPFTLHALGVFVVIGAIIVLRNSLTWRKRFIRLHRRHPRHVHRLRRLLRRKPEVWPVIWHELLRSERFFLPRSWRRFRRWRRAVMPVKKPALEPTRFDAAYFDKLYEADSDPWKFETSEYENRKYDATVAALDGRRFGRVLEVGCSIGVLTRKLAPHAEAVVALDISAAAIETARQRNPDLTHVAFLASGLMEADLQGPFDLILFSEVLYYLEPDELLEAARRMPSLLAPGGEVLLVNWLGKGHHPMSGHEAAETFMAALGTGFVRIAKDRQKRYRLDLLKRA